ncbi:MAG: C40 family peptidase [Chloroflexi bacterium]|nr:C40 family peptidase [Chloroflexota bacterium]
MKLLLGLLVCLVAVLTGLSLMVGAVIATHPWLAVGALSGPIRVEPSAVKSGVPADQWPLMVAAANQSSCHVSAEDLAAIAAIESNFGQNLVNRRSGAFGYGQFDAATWAAFGAGNPDSAADALPAMVRTLCARGYGVDRVRALNSYGGCVTPQCLGSTDYASSVSSMAASLSVPVDVVQAAQRWLGVPYVFGGCSKTGVDCSCLVQLVFQSLGMNLPRTAAEQFAVTARIPRESLQPGDLVFFANTYMPGISHVGIYIGGGQQINAPTEGQRVSVQPVFDGYWGAHFVAGGRLSR